MTMIKSLFKKYEEIIMYLIMGVLTTVVNIGVYYIFSHVFMLEKNISNVIAWVVAVLFAFITNKLFVFKSDKDIKKEIIEFFKYRLATLVMEVILFYLFINIIKMNDMIAKIILNVLVIILNYIFSKLFIFKKEKL